MDRSSGQYQRKTISTAAGEREVAVAGTYEQVDKNYTDSETGETINLGQDIFAVLQAPTKGIQEAADVVAFVLLIGGSFAIITKTNALNAGMSRVIKAQEQGHPHHSHHDDAAVHLRHYVWYV